MWFTHFIGLPSIFPPSYFPTVISLRLKRRPSYSHIIANPVSLAHLEENIVVNEGEAAVLNRAAQENVAVDQGCLAKGKKGKRVNADESLVGSSFEAVQIYTPVA